jgi:hypothetical protein
MISNELIEEKFKEFKEILIRIEEQTIKTNGRVNLLEAWRNTSNGALAVISCFVIPILLYLLYIHLIK